MTGVSAVLERRQGLVGRIVARLGAAARASASVAWLAEDGTVRLAPRGRALAVSARSGTVLVTQEGDPHDHVLSAGEAVRLAPRGVVVVWALEEAQVFVERAA